MFGDHTGFVKFVSNVNGVFNVDGKADGLPPLSVFVSMAHDVADEIVEVHSFGELRCYVVADAGFHSF